MGFTEIVAPTVKELFVRQIQGMILSGDLKTGDRLPTERELAQTMKISKTAVHEGLSELRRTGFLEAAPGRGLQVADYAQNGNLDTLLAIMQYHDGRMDSETACSLLDIRKFLEGPALEILAEKRTEEDLKVLEELEEKAREAVGTTEDELAQAFYTYHRTIAYLSGNRISPLVFNAFGPPILIFWKDFIRMAGSDVALSQLHDMTELIRERKGSEARALLEERIDQFKETYRNQPVF